MHLFAIHKAEQNSAAIDPWTLVHVASGLALGLMAVPLRWAMGAALVYEVVEQVVERSEWGQDLLQTSKPEVFPNVVVDLLVFAAGHELGVRWNRTGRRRR